MLDPTMNYTCGYWPNANPLEAAQVAKMDLVFRKVGLEPGDRVLDIGRGWGSLMKYAADTYDVSCVGVTVSEEQKALGEEHCGGLPIEFRLTDYRDVTGTFDHIVSIGMFEHVGPKNYRTFFKKWMSVLPTEGCSCWTPSAIGSPTTPPTPSRRSTSFRTGSFPPSSRSARPPSACW
ncbi:MAG: hypothetical protein BRD55_00385 [Bacteroidetes bacterium SW_9_63_38]|nr:MAG: hypothetical protein BRD55_00385 [Bacteroidetes bacterium SW_9_63_38]